MRDDGPVPYKPQSTHCTSKHRGIIARLLPGLDGGAAARLLLHLGHRLSLLHHVAGHVSEERAPGQRRLPARPRLGRLPARAGRYYVVDDGVRVQQVSQQRGAFLE